jgi:hypothetical protein
VEKHDSDHSAAATLDACARLRQLSAAPLHLADVAPRKRFLAEMRSLLDRMGRVVSGEHERAAHQHLEAIWLQETGRLEEAMGRPISVASALGVLEERWLRTNRDHPLDLTRRFAVLLLPMDDFSPEDWAFRAASRGLALQEGYLEGTASAAHYQLLLAPGWFVSLIPPTITGERLGLPPDAAPIASSCPADDLTEDEVQMVAALWTPDVRADLFSLEELREAVVRLRRLEDDDASRP